jgi:hypothetical protein
MDLYTVNVKDSDIFLHATSSKNYSDIESAGFLKRMTNTDDKNYPISKNAIYFEKYEKNGIYAGMNAAKYIEKYSMPFHCRVACRMDNSPQAVILQITGRNLNRLNCPIYVDPEKDLPFKKDESGELIRPLTIDASAPVFSIMILDKDIPFDYVKIFQRIPFKDIEHKF